MKRDIYTFENIIVNPNLEEVRLAIGKRVYAGNFTGLYNIDGTPNKEAGYFKIEES